MHAFVVPAEAITLYPWVKQGHQRGAKLDQKGSLGLHSVSHHLLRVVLTVLVITGLLLSTLRGAVYEHAEEITLRLESRSPVLLLSNQSVCAPATVVLTAQQLRDECGTCWHR